MGILSQNEEESKILYQFLQLVKPSKEKNNSGQNRRKVEPLDINPKKKSHAKFAPFVIVPLAHWPIPLNILIIFY